MCTISPHYVVSFFVHHSMERNIKNNNNNNTWTFLNLKIFFMKGFEILTERVCWYSCHSIIVICIAAWSRWKVMEHFVVFPNIVLCEEETNMAVACMMTCKIGLIDITSKPSIVFTSDMFSIIIHSPFPLPLPEKHLIKNPLPLITTINSSWKSNQILMYILQITSSSCRTCCNIDTVILNQWIVI